VSVTESRPINALPPTTPTPVLVRLLARYRRLRTGCGIPDALRAYSEAIDRAIDAELMDRALRSLRDRVTPGTEVAA
jgi:hypothetical protein